MMRLVHMVALTVLMATAAPALAQTQEKVQVTADRFVVAEDSNLATFSGNVVVVQGTTTINADTVEVHYGAGGASDIDSMTAEGHLVIVTPTHRVTGQRGVYDPETRIMRVFGNVVAESASGRVTGAELTVNFRTNVTEFDNAGGGRVTGVFNP